MVLRKARLAAEACGHRRAQQFRELLQLRPGFRPMHARARVDEWPLGREDRGSGLAHVGRVRRGARLGHGSVGELADLLLPDIGWYLDEAGSAAAVAKP